MMNRVLTGFLIVIILMAFAPVYSKPTKQPTTTPARKTKPPRALTKKELNTFLDRLQKEFGGIKTSATDFVQEKHLSILQESVRSTGRTLYRYPKTVRFEILSPFRSVLIASERQVAKYEHIQGKWKKLKLKNTDIMAMVMENVSTWLRGDFRKHRRIYDISAKQGEAVRVILTPRHKEFRKVITAIELQFDKKIKRLVSVTIRESGGDYTVMKFHNERRNINFPKAVFDTSLDQPVKVILPKKPKPSTKPAMKIKKRVARTRE